MIGALTGAMRLVDTWRDNRDKLEAPGVCCPRPRRRPHEDDVITAQRLLLHSCTRTTHIFVATMIILTQEQKDQWERDG